MVEWLVVLIAGRELDAFLEKSSDHPRSSRSANLLLAFPPVSHARYQSANFWFCTLKPFPHQSGQTQTPKTSHRRIRIYTTLVIESQWPKRESWIAPLWFNHDSIVVVYHLGENEVGRSALPMTARRRAGRSWSKARGVLWLNSQCLDYKLGFQAHHAPLQQPPPHPYSFEKAINRWWERSLCRRSSGATTLNFLLKPRDSRGNFTSEISARPRPATTLGPIQVWLSSKLAVGEGNHF